MADFEVDAEDWSGLKDAAARRKLQNRINQRLYRQRKAANRPARPVIGHWVRLDLPLPIRTSPQPGSRSIEDLPYVVARSDYPETEDAPALVLRSQSLASQVIQSSDQSSSASLPSSSSSAYYFPLSSDHLITLIYYNVFRAFNTNQTILQLHMYVFSCGVDDCHMLPSPSYATREIPHQLRPTQLQLFQPHNIWVDIFPHPRIRDNAIRQGDRFDGDEFCRDLVGSKYNQGEGFRGVDGKDGDENSSAHSTGSVCDDENTLGGLLVWGDAWDWQSWEATPRFIRKWGWLLEGCPEVIARSNYWRGLRGEEPMSFVV